MLEQTVGLNDFAVLDTEDGFLIGEGITQDQAFELLDRYETAVLQVLLDGEWINI